MSDYTKTTNFGAKDALPTGDSGKIVKGTEIDDEFDSIQTSNNSKANKVAGMTTNNMFKAGTAGDLADAGFLVDAFPVANIDIENATAETTPGDADLIPIFSDSNSANRVITRDNLFGQSELGGWIFTEKVDASGGNVTFNTAANFSSDYVSHAFVLSDILLSASAELWLLTSSNGGSSYDSSSGNYAWQTLTLAGVAQASTSATKIVLKQASGAHRINGTVMLHNPSGSQRTTTESKLVYGTTTGASFACEMAFGVRLSAADVDALRFTTSSGNITSGSIRHYRLRAASTTL